VHSSAQHHAAVQDRRTAAAAGVQNTLLHTGVLLLLLHAIHTFINHAAAQTGEVSAHFHGICATKQAASAQRTYVELSSPGNDVFALLCALDVVEPYAHTQQRVWTAGSFFYCLSP
jgi:hypothetical protein